MSTAPSSDAVLVGPSPIPSKEIAEMVCSAMEHAVDSGVLISMINTLDNKSAVSEYHHITNLYSKLSGQVVYTLQNTSPLVIHPQFRARVLHLTNLQDSNYIACTQTGGYIEVLLLTPLSKPLFSEALCAELCEREDSRAWYDASLCSAIW